MGKRIIVEGADGSGKSTLILALTSAYPNLLVLHDGYNHQNQPPYYEDWVRDLINTTEMPIPVHNRFFYSELVYGPILRGNIRISKPGIEKYKKILRREAFLIYCVPSYENLVKFVTANEQMEGVIPNLSKIYKAYDELMGEELAYYWPEGRCVSYDFTRDPLNKVVEAVGMYLNS